MTHFIGGRTTSKSVVMGYSISACYDEHESKAFISIGQNDPANYITYVFNQVIENAAFDKFYVANVSAIALAPR